MREERAPQEQEITSTKVWGNEGVPSGFVGLLFSQLVVSESLRPHGL